MLLGLNPNSTYLGEKLWPVAWKQEFTTSVIFGLGYKNVIFENPRSKNSIERESSPEHFDFGTIWRQKFR